MLLVLAVTSLGSDLIEFGLLSEVNRAGGLSSRGSRLIPERRTIGGGDSLFDLGSLNLQTRLERQDVRLSYPLEDRYSSHNVTSSFSVGRHFIA
jgi:hypothetical protein